MELLRVRHARLGALSRALVLCARTRAFVHDCDTHTHTHTHTRTHTRTHTHTVLDCGAGYNIAGYATLIANQAQPHMRPPVHGQTHTRSHSLS